MIVANVEMAAAWDGAEGNRWTAHADRYEATAPGYWRALLAAVPIEPDAAVLDIGCGTGRSTREVARLASAGSALGVDLSAKMLEHARAAARDEGLSNVRFEQADAQVHPFPPGAFDLAVSMFGAMFFADPVAAFANMHRALRPGGGLALLVWRGLQHNEWVAALREALSAGRALPTPPADTPGPFGLADPSFTRRVLTDAGFVDVDFDEVVEPIRFGDDADDAFAFVTTMGLTIGLTQDLDDARKAAALDALHATLVEHESGDGVLFGGSAWLVHAAATTLR
ncbi:MAG: methyltransferase domain-containing protein [Actinomycetota bacterium]|nr:methyltransferase domain-containing protein [Actinomycetota bacterium]